MNYLHLNMIRSSRLFFFGRKNYNIPPLTQRAALSPKQVYIEFSVSVNTEAVSEEEKKTFTDEHPSRRPTYTAQPFRIPETQMAFSVIKVMSQKGLKVDNINNNPALRDFLQKLVLHKTEDILKLLKTFALTNNRAVPAIKGLCEALFSRGYNYAEHECSDLLFSLAKLSFRHEALIKKIVEHLKLKGQFESVKIVSSILQSLSILRHRDCELLDKILKSYTADSSDIDSSVNILVSLAHLNYCAPTVDNIIKVLSECEDTDYQQTKNYINFIWACVLLNKHMDIPVKHLQKVLSRSFFEKLEFGREGLHVGVHLKMLNIFAAALQISSVKELLVNKLTQQNFLSPPVPQQKNMLLESIKDTLGYILSKSVNLETLVDTRAGFFLDFQCTIDSKTSPLLMKKKESCKLGIVLLNYHDLCSDGTMTGLSAFKVKLLTSQGYKIITISHTDYPINAKLSEKIVYLRNLIVDTVNGSSDSNAKVEKNDEKI